MKNKQQKKKKNNTKMPYCGDLVLGLLMGKFPEFLTEICLRHICISIFSFLDDNWSKSKWIFTKLGICIDIVEIWFGIAIWQIS